MKHLVTLSYGGKTATYADTLRGAAALLRILRSAGFNPSVKIAPIWG